MLEPIMRSRENCSEVIQQGSLIPTPPQIVIGQRTHEATLSNQLFQMPHDRGESHSAWRLTGRHPRTSVRRQEEPLLPNSLRKQSLQPR